MATPVPMPTSTLPVAPQPTTVVPEASSTIVLPDPTSVVVTAIPPGGGMGGDPHFNIVLPNHQQLCFSVQGEHGYSFNLISNKLIHMNARFVPDPKREEVTWIGSLGIVVTSRKMNETKIRFEAKEKMIYIGEKLSLHVRRVEKLTFSDGKMTVSEGFRGNSGGHFRVGVELVDIGLSFSVNFVKEHLDLTWNKVGRQPPKSHGIIGKYLIDT